MMSRTILMLEQDEDDRYITEAVFKENQYNLEVHFVNTSQEMLSYLGACEKNNIKYPSLILMNYHAIPSNAIAVLNELKSNPKYRYIPVVVLCGSTHDNIVKECYAAGASSFIQKPSLQHDIQRKISNFVHYWFETVELQ
jgi:response regulator RpfG family c-di-GMP phosphodiesterase